LPRSRCTDTSTVVITASIELPQFNIAQPEVLTCDSTERQLFATVVNADGFDPFWTTNGNILAGATGLSPTVNEPGSYQLVMRNPTTGCADSLSVNVVQDTTAPVVLIAQAAPLTCSRPSLLLDAAGSTPGNDIAYSWSTNDGNFAGTPTGLTPQVNAAGNYQLLATNMMNGCEASATVTVLVDTLRPVINLVQSDTALTCLTPSVDLSVPATDPGIRVLWAGPGVADTARLINAVTPGDYAVLLVNSDNGCRDSSTITLPAYQELPVLAIAPPPVLTCAAPSVSLDAAVTDPEDFEVLWSGAGPLTIGADVLSPVITQRGAYQLLLINPATGCRDSAQVTVVQNVISPEAIIDAPAELTCQQPVLQLDAQSSSEGDTISYSWSTTDGSLVSGQTSTLPFVNSPGMYQLTVLNTNNGCSDSTIVVVIDNADRPDLELGENRTLNCTDTTQLLTSLTPPGANLTFRWSAASGDVSNATQPDLEVSEPGTYYLTLTNSENGCFSVDSLVINQDIDTPVAEISGPERLTCSVPEVTLSGQDATAGHPVDYRWSSGADNTLTWLGAWSGKTY